MNEHVSHLDMLREEVRSLKKDDRILINWFSLFLRGGIKLECNICAKNAFTYEWLFYKFALSKIDTGTNELQTCSTSHII